MAKMRLIVFKGFSSFAESLFSLSENCIPRAIPHIQGNNKKASPGGEALNMC